MSKLVQSTVVGSLSMYEQEGLVEETRHVLEEAPLVRPTTPGGTPMRVRVSAAGMLGWVGDGAYRYSPKQANGKRWPVMPMRWRKLATQFGGNHPWDSAIVNWYDADAGLGWHTDRSEVDTSLPIVTISLGDACVWAVRQWEDQVASRTRLESGAVTLLAGETRGLQHSVERIIASPLFSPLSVRGRISITIRVAGVPLADD